MGLGLRPMRADARRNYDRLLAAGAAAFTERGPEASLEDIARRAGVGIGTLYRHFPTRQALLEAVYLDRVQELCGVAGELADHADPGEALLAWLRAFAAHVTGYRSLKAFLAAAMRDAGSPLSSCHLMLREAGTTLLTRAQQSGAARADLDITELLRLVHGLVMACDQAKDDTVPVDRLLSLLMDGLRGGGAAGGPDASPVP